MRVEKTVGIMAGVLAAAMLIHTNVWAHCDGMDGPVITDAKAALEEGDVERTLKWIPEDDEQEVREAFEKTLTVRQHGPEARELADRYFFETLVRLHREYEGAAFTGILPSGTPVSPPIERADAALETGDVDALARDIAEAVETRIREEFAATREAQAVKDESVEQGRAYVDQYVQFVHFVKYLHDAATGEHNHGHATTDPHGHGQHAH